MTAEEIKEIQFEKTDTHIDGDSRTTEYTANIKDHKLLLYKTTYLDAEGEGLYTVSYYILDGKEILTHKQLLDQLALL